MGASLGTRRAPARTLLRRATRLDLVGPFVADRRTAGAVTADSPRLGGLRFPRFVEATRAPTAAAGRRACPQPSWRVLRPSRPSAAECCGAGISDSPRRLAAEWPLCTLDRLRTLDL